MFRTSLTRKQADETAISAGLAPAGLRLPTAVEAKVTGARSVLVPVEHVALQVVDLPMTSQRQRSAAVGFAVEEELAEPLEDVHVALGAEVERGQHLTATARHSKITAWMRALTETGIPRHRLVPDALALPRPAEGRWAISPSPERILVRTPDGGGFAGSPEFFAKAWARSDRPRLIAATGGGVDAAPSGIEISVPGPDDLIPERDVVAAGFDLCTGRYTRQRSDLWRTAQRVAAIAVLAALAQVGLTALDARFVADLHTAKDLEARAELRALAPTLASAPNPAAALRSLLASGKAPRSGRFLHLLTILSEALDPNAEGIALSSVGYSSEAGELTVALSAGDLAALQRVEERFGAAGLSPESGPATVRDGSAEATLILTDPGASR